MPSDFGEISNFREREVFETIRSKATQYPMLALQELAIDVACVALNRLPARYIRHEADFLFYQGDVDRVNSGRMVLDAVIYAIEFIQAREAMRART